MMRLYLDCEWNGYKGSLISVALSPEDPHLQDFYVEIELPVGEKLDPWVEQHVMPFLHGEPVPYRIAQRSLQAYLSRFGQVWIVADWPEDIERVCRLMILAPGERIAYTKPVMFSIEELPDARSRVPHNALEDARANRDAGAKLRRQS